MQWNVVTSIMAAIAAIASAISTFFMYRIMRRADLDSVRPELILDGWQFLPSEQGGEILIDSIENIGKGPALHPLLVMEIRGGNKNAHGFLTHDHFALIPPGTRRTLQGKGRFLWSDYPKFDEQGMIGLDIVIMFWDYRNRRHEIRERLVAIKPAENVGCGPSVLAPWLMTLQRVYSVRSVRSLRLEAYLKTKQQEFEKFYKSI
jgi:hypothetical protein